MSDPKYVLELSEEAYDDLINIQNYTYDHYGENGWASYGYDLDRAIQHIMNHPHTGHTREDIPSGYQAWNVNENVMVYRIKEQKIYVVRVLHKKMDFRFQF